MDVFNGALLMVLFSKGMSNIYLKVTNEKNWRFGELQLTQISMNLRLVAT